MMTSQSVINVIIAFILLAAVTFFDFISGPELSASIFYLIPVIFVSWYFGARLGITVAVGCAGLWLISDMLSGHDYTHPAIPYWNALVRMGTFLLVAYIFIKLQNQLRREKEHSENMSRANEEIKRLASVKSEFLSIVSHELRTPLTAIKESLGIINDRSAGPLTDDQSDFLDTAVRNVDRLGRLIDDVLDFQKLEAGRMEFKMVSADINLIIREVARGFIALAQRKGLELKLNLEESLPKVELDKDKITQVLNNLISNAIKFSNHGTITIITDKLGDVVRVAVQDQGIGIKEEDRPKLFQSFSQIASEDDRKTGGTGLGLVISKSIVEQLSGTMGVKSLPGKGSTFYFTLRCANA